MKKYFIAIMLLLLASLSSLRAEDKPVILHPSSTTHGAGQGKKPRTPAYVPEVYIDGHVLSFEESCIGCPITIIDENENTVFSAIVDEDGIVTLPDSLTGTFVLELEWGSIIFEGEIEL